MAIGKKTGGKDFEPGRSGNPNGRPPLPEDIKEARKLNRIEFERVLNKMIYMTRDELKEHVTNPDTPALEIFVAKILSVGINKGDERRLGFIIDRLLGPVKTKVSLSGDEDENAPPIRAESALSNDQLIQIIRAARGENK